MPLFEQFPYTNFHDLNLDRILRAMEELKKEVDQYLSYETITYADPIQWSITTQYKANTVVLDPAGTAYLSTQAVPANILLSDTEYWTPIGNFSELYASIKESICSIDFGYGTATMNITTGTVFWYADQLRRAVTAISSGQMINDTNSEIVDVIQLINAATAGTGTEKRYIFIGDSYGEGYNPDGNTISYSSQIVTKLNLDAYHAYVTNVGGSGFCNGTTFLYQLINLYSTVQDKLSITDIFVIGGRNDYAFGTSEIEAAISAFMSYCESYYPNATVHIGYVGRAYERTENARMELQFRTLASYIQCQKYGAEYIKNIQYVLANSSLYASDGRHPTQDGQNTLTAALLTYMEGGAIDIAYQGYTTATPSGDNTSETTASVLTEMHNGETRYTFGPNSISANANKTWNKTQLELYTLGQTTAEGSRQYTANITIPVVARFAGSPRYRAIPAEVMLIDNKVNALITLINNDGTNFLMDTLQEIQFPPYVLKYSTDSGN